MVILCYSVCNCFSSSRTAQTNKHTHRQTDATLHYPLASLKLISFLASISYIDDCEIVWSHLKDGDMFKVERKIFVK